jgi:hypothetical protein
VAGPAAVGPCRDPPPRIGEQTPTDMRPHGRPALDSASRRTMLRDTEGICPGASLIRGPVPCALKPLHSSIFRRTWAQDQARRPSVSGPFRVSPGAASRTDAAGTATWTYDAVTGQPATADGPFDNDTLTYRLRIHWGHPYEGKSSRNQTPPSLFVPRVRHSRSGLASIAPPRRPRRRILACLGLSRVVAGRTGGPPFSHPSGSGPAPPAAGLAGRPRPAFGGPR